MLPDGSPLSACGLSHAFNLYFCSVFVEGKRLTIEWMSSIAAPDCDTSPMSHIFITYNRVEKAIIPSY